MTDNRELEHKFELLQKDVNIMEVNVDRTLKTMRSDIDGTLKTMRLDIDGTLKTMRLDIDKTLHQLRADNNNLRTDIERINTEAAKRETRMILTMVGLVVGGIAILGFILA